MCSICLMFTVFLVSWNTRCETLPQVAALDAHVVCSQCRFKCPMSTHLTTPLNPAPACLPACLPVSIYAAHLRALDTIYNRFVYMRFSPLSHRFSADILISTLVKQSSFSMHVRLYANLQVQAIILTYHNAQHQVYYYFRISLSFFGGSFCFYERCQEPIKNCENFYPVQNQQQRRRGQ